MSGCINSLPACSERKTQVIPSGLTNCLNLVYSVPDVFEAGSLEVFVDGRRLTPTLDFSEAVGLNGFTIILNPSNPNRLNKAIGPNEDLRVDYLISQSGCISIL